MVKEELLTFDGWPLLPERVAETLRYQLSSGERERHEAVTQYVREEMNRADQLKVQGDRPRGNTVGFALTVFQRRLASSPEAVLRARRGGRPGGRCRRRTGVCVRLVPTAWGCCTSHRCAVASLTALFHYRIWSRNPHGSGV
jgi:hypothetical protein